MIVEKTLGDVDDDRTITKETADAVFQKMADFQPLTLEGKTYIVRGFERREEFLPTRTVIRYELRETAWFC